MQTLNLIISALLKYYVKHGFVYTVIINSGSLGINAFQSRTILLCAVFSWFFKPFSLTPRSYSTRKKKTSITSGTRHLVMNRATVLVKHEACKNSSNQFGISSESIYTIKLADISLSAASVYIFLHAIDLETQFNSVIGKENIMPIL